MTPKERYDQYEMIGRVLEEGMARIDDALNQMEKPIADMPFQSAETRKALDRARRELLLLKSAIQRHRYAKVSFR